MRPPLELLIDYGDTLVEELREDRAAGTTWLFAQASHVPAGITLADVLARAECVRRDVDARRVPGEIEMPWAQLVRLIYYPLGVRFEAPMEELELGAWQRIIDTRPMPGAREALAQLHAAGLRLGVVSNASFGPSAIRWEIARHGLAEHLAFVTTSSEYGVRKPNALLFGVAAARLGVAPRDIWFLGDRLDKDIAGAKAAGMTAVWFRGVVRAAAAAHGVTPDLVVHSWAELLERARGSGLARA